MILSFFVDGGLSKIKCTAQDIGSEIETKSYAKALAQQLAKRYGVPTDGKGIEEEPGFGQFSNLDGSWSWRTDDGAVLALKVSFQDVVGMRTSKVTLTQTCAEHKKVLDALATKQEERQRAQKAKRRQQERERIEKLKKQSKDDPI